MLFVLFAGSFVFKRDLYWTLPYDYAEMRYKSPELYTKLAASNLLIFKGKLLSLSFIDSSV